MLDTVVNNILRSDWIALLVVGTILLLATELGFRVRPASYTGTAHAGPQGYTTALGEAGRHALAMVILPILFTIVITIIADLDHPQRGLIKVGQQSMLDLQNTLKKYQ
jgi:hypothetical protein